MKLMTVSNRLLIALHNANLVWSTSGSYLKDKTKNYQAGYVVVSLTENTEAGPITAALLAQEAELFALIRA